MQPKTKPGMIRNMTRYQSRYHNIGLPVDMLYLVKRFAEETCEKRDGCDRLGMISCCLQCFCDQILIPDMRQVYCLMDCKGGELET